MPRSRTVPKLRSPRAAIQAVVVELVDDECNDFDVWLRRATDAGGPPEQFIRFATWYPAVLERWFDAAKGVGVWEAGHDPGRPVRGYCRHPSEALSHAERGDGLVVHFVVDTDSRPYLFRARVCRDAPPLRRAPHRTDDQRLTWEEFTSGEPCRGCGRGFVGTHEWKPILHRTPEEAEAIEREEADFRALHPNCATMTWRYGSTGVTHCSECCPMPPLSPGQVKNIARIVAEILQHQDQDAIDTERRWRATSDVTVT
jgi:hypothetical protein